MKRILKKILFVFAWVAIGGLIIILSTAAVKERTETKIPFWVALGCGSGESKTQIPNYAKHYFNLEEKEFFFHPLVTYLNDSHSSLQFLFDYRFDQPPRGVLISSLI